MTVSSPDNGNTDTPTRDEPAAYYEDGWKWAPGMPRPMTPGEIEANRPDPGVPTGDNPRWTVDEDEVDLGPQWITGSERSSYEDVWEALTEQQQAALVQAVRDAALVPALQATADKWEQAREALGAFTLDEDRGLLVYEHSDGECCAVSVSCPAVREVLSALLDLLTEAPNGE